MTSRTKNQNKAENLLDANWASLDSAELLFILKTRVGGPGQYDGRADNPNRFYLPLARSSCKIALTFRRNEIVRIEPGPAFDRQEWDRLSEEVGTTGRSGQWAVGREFSFSSYRVHGSWRGKCSGVQILPPPDDAPRAAVEMADHPFILEFPIKVSDFWPISNYRRQRGHRNMTLLLNVLLEGRTTLQARQSEHVWALIVGAEGSFRSEWVQTSFFAHIGVPVTEDLSPPHSELLQQVECEEYYAEVGYECGRGLRVPTNLDASICRYLQLSPTNRSKFDRATFWMDVASRQWAFSVSASFASLVSAIESLTDRGTTHSLYCKQCKTDCQHDAPGATEQFRAFLENFAPGASLRTRRGKMYGLRSGILHGDQLMQLDQDLAFGWHPPGWDERELHDELWSLTRTALRNWLTSPPPYPSP